jgi:hypothetical protein
MKHIKDMAAKSVHEKLRAMGGMAHSDEKEDRSLVKKMVKPHALTGHADGGRAHKGKGKGHTQVNVIVPQRGQTRAVPVPVPVPVRGAGAGPVVGMPSRTVAPPPSIVPSGTMKKGGKVHRANGGKTYHAGSESGLGRLEKTHKYGIKSHTKI